MPNKKKPGLQHYLDMFYENHSCGGTNVNWVLFTFNQPNLFPSVFWLWSVFVFIEVVEDCSGAAFNDEITGTVLLINEETLFFPPSTKEQHFWITKEADR